MRMSMKIGISLSKEYEEFWGMKQSKVQTVGSRAEIEEPLTYLS